MYDFGILMSNVHNSWMRVVAMRMKSDYSYSLAIVYNNFPWPSPTDKQKKKIEENGTGHPRCQNYVFGFLLGRSL